MPVRPFRFLAVPGDLSSSRAIAATARRAEAVGYSALVLPDHLIDQPGPFPVLATIAAATDRLRIGTFVLNNDLRHPAVLAQDLAGLDVLSEGRLDIGLGAGWNEPEYDQLGLRFEPVGTRIERLAESIAVLKGCFAPGPFSFAGRHYTIRDYDGRPEPVQRPHPPILVGGGGRRVLTLAGREADIVGFAPRVRGGQRVDPDSISLAATAEKVGWVRDAAGDRFDRLELNIYPSGWPATITDDAHGEARKVADRIRQRTGVELDVPTVLDSPHVFVGSIDGLAEKFSMLRDRFGISSFMVGEVGPLDPLVERLAGS